MGVEMAVEYARSRLAKASELVGEDSSCRASFVRSADDLAKGYGIVEQYTLIASELIAGGRPEAESKMAAFWAARRFFAPDNDGGMKAAAEELEAENAIIGAELDEMEAEFRHDYEGRT